MDYVYILMGTYQTDPECEVIFGVYRTSEAAYEVKDRLFWDSHIRSAYILREEIHQ